MDAGACGPGDFFWCWVVGGIGFQSLFWRWLGWCRCLFWACWGTALFGLVAGRAESAGAGPWVTGGMGGPPMGAPEKPEAVQGGHPVKDGPDAGREPEGDRQ